MLQDKLPRACRLGHKLQYTCKRQEEAEEGYDDLNFALDVDQRRVVVKTNSLDSLRVDVFFCLVSVKNIIGDDVRKGSEFEGAEGEQFEEFLHVSRDFGACEQGVENCLDEDHDHNSRRSRVAPRNISCKQHQHH